VIGGMGVGKLGGERFFLYRITGCRRMLIYIFINRVFTVSVHDTPIAADVSDKGTMALL